MVHGYLHLPLLASPELSSPCRSSNRQCCGAEAPTVRSYGVMGLVQASSSTIVYGILLRLANHTNTTNDS